jgi:hypothetical protein
VFQDPGARRTGEFLSRNKALAFKEYLSGIYPRTELERERCYGADCQGNEWDLVWVRREKEAK